VGLLLRELFSEQVVDTQFRAALVRGVGEVFS
jgi:hypothetical protein